MVRTSLATFLVLAAVTASSVRADLWSEITAALTPRQAVGVNDAGPTSVSAVPAAAVTNPAAEFAGIVNGVDLSNVDVGYLVPGAALSSASSLLPSQLATAPRRPSVLVPYPGTVATLNEQDKALGVVAKSDRRNDPVPVFVDRSPFRPPGRQPADVSLGLFGVLRYLGIPAVPIRPQGLVAPAPALPLSPPSSRFLPGVPSPIVGSQANLRDAAEINGTRLGVAPKQQVEGGLEAPVPSECSNRRSDFTFGNHRYQFSWNSGAAPTNWIGARNFCRRQCMDLVSLETAEENSLIKDIVADAWRRGQLEFVWTSGRLCDFPGCDRPDLQPPEINGWFWSGSAAQIAPKGKGFNDWGISTVAGQQPDNREGGESCVALLNPSIYNEPSGQFKWHDIACHHVKAFVCEDADALLAFAGQQR